jgi:hypothetical protein
VAEFLVMAVVLMVRPCGPAGPRRRPPRQAVGGRGADAAAAAAADVLVWSVRWWRWSRPCSLTARLRRYAHGAGDRHA